MSFSLTACKQRLKVNGPKVVALSFLPFGKDGAPMRQILKVAASGIILVSGGCISLTHRALLPKGALSPAGPPTCLYAIQTAPVDSVGRFAMEVTRIDTGMRLATGAPGVSLLCRETQDTTASNRGRHDHRGISVSSSGDGSRQVSARSGGARITAAVARCRDPRILGKADRRRCQLPGS